MKKKGVVLLVMVLLAVNTSAFAEDINYVDELGVANRNVGVMSMYEVEPNDTPAQAKWSNEIRANTQWRRGSVSLSDTVDFYHYNHLNYGNMKITLFNISSSSKVRVEIYREGSDGNLIYLNGRTTTGIQYSLDVLNAQAGHYFIKINHIGSYKISYDIMIDAK